MDCSIRDASLTDLQLLVEIIKKSFRDVADQFGLTPENCPKHPSNCSPDWIESAFRKGVRYFILEKEGLACGCAAMETAGPEVVYLERLAVLPPFRRCGHGKALVEHIIEIARAEGAHRVEIGIISDQTELKEWYRRIDFVETGTASFQHLPFSVAFMARMLPIAG